MIKTYKVVIPEKGLTKEQLKVMANHRLSLAFFIEHEGEILEKEAIPDWPDFLLQEEVKEPVVLSADDAWRTRTVEDHSIDQTWKDFYQGAFDRGDKNGQIREYQRKEQVELRGAVKALKEKDKGIPISTHFACLLSRVYDALENLKSP